MIRSTTAVIGRGRVVAAVALAGLACSFAGANITVNIWNSPTSFHHKRVGVPDMDQRRVGLPNGGDCYCAPTAYVNMMIYIANHGYPQVTPGVGDFTGYDHYYDVTSLLEELGANASISPGGPDPSDPDCNGQGGGNGECDSLPCGGKITNVFNAFDGAGYFGTARDNLVFTAKSLDPNAPSTSFTALGQLAIAGNIIEICYGRYAPVGTVSGITVYKRGSGHCITMNGIDREGSDLSISVRDPAQDDGDPFGPSPFVTKIYDITNLALLTTSDDPEQGPIVNVALNVLPAIDEPQSDGKKRLVDGYFAIRPKSGVFWKDLQFVKDLPLSVGFGVDPIPHPAPLAPILDLVQDENNLGWFVLTAGNAGTPPQLLKMNPISGDVDVLATTTATQLAINRFDDLFTMVPSPPSVESRSSLGVLKATASLAGVPRAIACDDQKDLLYVVVPGSSGFGGTIVGYPRSLGAPVKTWTIGSSVQLGASMRAAVNPTDGTLWIASATTDIARGFSLPATPRGPVAPVESITGFSVLTGIDFDDGGRAYLVNDGAVKVFERSSSGQWTAVDAGAFNGVDVGSMVRIAKSRSNFDPALHDTPDWNNFEVDQLEVLGVSVPDCLGDLNGDATIDAADLAILLGQWGGNGIADLDASGAVNAADLGILLGGWGGCG